MNTKILAHIGLLCIQKIMKLFTLIVEYVPKEIKKAIGNKDIKTNIFRIQAYNSIICGYFCILFTDFMLAGGLIDFTNLFSHYDF